MVFLSLALCIGFVTLTVYSKNKPEIDKLTLTNIDIPAKSRMSLIVITHGWIEKGPGDWPEDMALEIQKRIDPNNWLCGYFDWEKGAGTINATNAAKYARDRAGPALAQQILELDNDFQHIHLIGHSSSSWLISEAAKILVDKTKADIHLTLLDAYVPVFWDEDSPSGTKTHWQI
jgi:hypothetical protein